MKRLSETGKAYLADVVCHGAWGFSFLFTRIALDRTEVFTLLSHRFLLAFALLHLFPGQLRAMKASRKQKLLLLALGLAQPVLYYIGEEYGILHATTGFSGVMIAMIPIVSILAAALILKERATVGQYVFSAVSVCGVIGLGLLSGSSGRLDWIGVGALTVAVCAGVCYSLLSRSLSREATPFTRTYAMIGTGAAAFTVLAFLTNGGDLSAYVRPLTDLRYDLSVAFLSVLCTVICFFLSGYALTRLPVARETAFANLTTAVSVFAGVLILREPFSWAALGFCAMILLGVWGVQHAARGFGDRC